MLLSENTTISFESWLRAHHIQTSSQGRRSNVGAALGAARVAGWGPSLLGRRLPLGSPRFIRRGDQEGRRNNSSGSKDFNPLIPRSSSVGFTMIELMIVLTIISILVSIAIPIANAAILSAKEAVLKSNLHTLRTLIDQYTADKLKAPQSLSDLVSASYLRSIPKDPITNSSETWEVVMEDATRFPEQTESGIFDVHSGSTAISSEGTPYNTW